MMKMLLVTGCTSVVWQVITGAASVLARHDDDVSTATGSTQLEPPL